MSAGEAAGIIGVQEAAAELGLSIARVRRFCETDRIPARKIGKTWVIFSSDLEDFRKKPRVEGFPAGKKRSR